MLRLVNGFLHGFEKLIFHVVVHVGDKVVHNVFGFLDLAEIVFELDIFHHVGLFKDGIGGFDNVLNVLLHIF